MFSKKRFSLSAHSLHSHLPLSVSWHILWFRRSQVYRYRRLCSAINKNCCAALTQNSRNFRPTPIPPINKSHQPNNPPEKTRKNSNKQSAQGKIKESRSGEPEGRENGDWQKAKLRSHCAADVAAFSLCSFRIWFWFHSWNVRCAVMTLTVGVCCLTTHPPIHKEKINKKKIIQARLANWYWLRAFPQLANNWLTTTKKWLSSRIPRVCCCLLLWKESGRKSGESGRAERGHRHRKHGNWQHVTYTPLTPRI